MTIIKGMDVKGIIEYHPNLIHNAIKKAKPIDKKLHVVIVLSNPCKFMRRYILANEFIERFEEAKNEFVELYVVELEYGDNPSFEITSRDNPKHLQIRCPEFTPIWHKENMINLGVRYLLPDNWKAMAWIDADLEFDSPTWAEDTLKILGSGKYHVVQLFSQALDLDQNGDIMQIFTSFGYQYANNKKYSLKYNVNNYWHPGFAWAITREAYDKIGGLYEYAILGSGDHYMSLCFLNIIKTNINNRFTKEYLNEIYKFQDRVNNANIKVGYVPGVILHYFHGSKKNRKYAERNEILFKYNFKPNLHVKKNNFGLIVPTEKCPKGLLDEILDYFQIRNEDECFDYKSNLVDYTS
jgi:hypothetical protein